MGEWRRGVDACECVAVCLVGWVDGWVCVGWGWGVWAFAIPCICAWAFSCAYVFEIRRRGRPNLRHSRIGCTLEKPACMRESFDVSILAAGCVTAKFSGERRRGHQIVPGTLREVRFWRLSRASCYGEDLREVRVALSLRWCFCRAQGSRLQYSGEGRSRRRIRIHAWGCQDTLSTQTKAVVVPMATPVASVSAFSSVLDGNNECLSVVFPVVVLTLCYFWMPLSGMASIVGRGPFCAYSLPCCLRSACSPHGCGSPFCAFLAHR